MIDFTEEQLERYSRHILLDNVGIEGQEKLLGSKVFIIGAGGLGSPSALYLAAAGIGTIGIADADTVDLSNLQRQIIHFTRDVGTPKVASAKAKMEAINPDVKVIPHHTFVAADSIRSLIRGYDFVIDGTDNFAAKFLINDACVLEKIPFSHGGILRFTGQTMTVIPGKSACYRCVFNGPPPKNAVPACSQAGVLGAIAGMLGTIQAAETLKYLLGIGTPLTNQLLSFEALDMRFRTVALRQRTTCPVCGTSPGITDVFDEEQVVCAIKQERS